MSPRPQRAPCAVAEETLWQYHTRNKFRPDRAHTLCGPGHVKSSNPGTCSCVVPHVSPAPERVARHVPTLSGNTTPTPHKNAQEAAHSRERSGPKVRVIMQRTPAVAAMRVARQKAPCQRHAAVTGRNKNKSQSLQTAVPHEPGPGEALHTHRHAHLTCYVPGPAGPATACHARRAPAHSPPQARKAPRALRRRSCQSGHAGPVHESRSTNQSCAGTPCRTMRTTELTSVGKQTKCSASYVSSLQHHSAGWVPFSELTSPAATHTSTHKCLARIS